MKRIVRRTALMACMLTAGAAAAQDFGITSFDRQGRLVFDPAPAGHLCFVERCAAPVDATWTNETLCLNVAGSGVDIAPSGGFFRVAAHAATALCRYPLTNDANDALGHFGPMNIVNSPFTNGGVWCNGIYQSGGDPDGSSIGTPALTNLDFSGFLMAIEFMAVTNLTKPIFVGGDLWRWGGVYTRSDGTAGMLFNDAGPYPGVQPYTTGVWHEAVFVYTATNKTAEIYLDGRLAGRGQGDLIHNNDGDVHNTHYGNGQTFLGYLRNLRVWNLR